MSTSTQPVALVTGSGQGIGRGIALRLAADGYAVAINDIVADPGNTEQGAYEVKKTIEAGTGRAEVFKADIASSGDRETMIASILETFGRIDLLVNNAGIGPRQRVDMLQVSADSYDEVMAVNLRGPFFLTQRVANAMIRLLQAGIITAPKIVNIGSISAYTSSTDRAEYCLSKAGLGMMTALWADRLAPYGIGVYEVRPGIIDTDLTAAAQAKYDRLIIDEGLTPIRRWGRPQDIGQAVVAIAADYFPFSTGEVFNVDGGFHLRRL